MYKYLEYLPIYLREVRELRALGEAVDPPAQKVCDYTAQKYLNQFIQSADIPTLSRWEAIFRMNGSSLDIEERRKRILVKFRLRAPITIKTLKEIIETFTGSACEVLVDYAHYHMLIKIFQVSGGVDLLFLFSEIYTLKPANITFDMHEFSEWQFETKIYCSTTQSLLSRSNIDLPLPKLHRRSIAIQGACGRFETTRLSVLTPYCGQGTARRQTIVGVGSLASNEVSLHCGCRPTATVQQNITYCILHGALEFVKVMCPARRNLNG